ncbi:MAG: tyrosine-type recombinase/integrase [Fusobacteriaceae bacterium]
MLDEYLNYLKSNQKVSDRTCEIYKYEIQFFMDFLRGDSILEVTPRIIETYSGYLKKIGMSNVSIKRKLASLSGFYRYLLRREKIFSNPVTNAKFEYGEENNSRAKKVIEIDVQKILEYCPDDQYGMRDKVVIRLLESTNLNITQVLALEMKEIISSREINLIKKNKKIIINIEDEKLVEDFKKYLEESRDRIQEENTHKVFKDFSRQTFRSRFIKYSALAGYEDTIISPSDVKKSNKKKFGSEEEIKADFFEKLRAEYMRIGIGDD